MGEIEAAGRILTISKSSLTFLGLIDGRGPRIMIQVDPKAEAFPIRDLSENPGVRNYGLGREKGGVEGRRMRRWENGVGRVGVEALMEDGFP